ncbi:MAG: Fic family protein [Turicibacter sp.]|nr:Fic family protein [Turicibacter sp.]
MYELLSKIFYKNPSKYEEEFLKRFEGYGTVKLPLRIKPFKSSEEFQCFYVIHNRLMLKYEEILKNSKEIELRRFSLPTVAIRQYIESKLKEELVSTNAIEGVRSSRKQIAEALEANEVTGKRVRFSSLVHSYSILLSSDSFLPITKAGDIRKLYNEIVAEEVTGRNTLDGAFFRKEPVDVLAASGTGRVIHSNSFSEEKIQSKLSEMLFFLNEFETPMLYKIAIVHYYFGFIHPFYDGNGRVSRYLSSLYLKHELDTLTALTLSYATNKIKEVYYEGFEQANNPLNKGDLTMFCDSFLKIIGVAQENILTELAMKEVQLNKLRNVLDEMTEMMPEMLEILFIVGQSSIFGYIDEGISLKDLKSIHGLDVAKTRISRVLDELENLGLVQCISRKPKIVSLSGGFMSQLELT